MAGQAALLPRESIKSTIRSVECTNVPTKNAPMSKKISKDSKTT